jgi:hypothetical protein
MISSHEIISVALEKIVVLRRKKLVVISANITKDVLMVNLFNSSTGPIPIAG